MATTPNYDINYDDKRFTEVESDKKAALTEVEKTYGGMISASDKFYQDQINASKQWAETQKKNQQEQTDFAIEQINQQKDQAKKDYTKEQSGSYADWQKQSNPYGANAEKMASQGMLETGYSESSQVSMYNTYQNRVATAREAYTRAILNYDNAIKDARLQNNSALAEIAYQALQEQLKLSLEGFQYKNGLIIEKANKKLEVESTYYARYQDVLQQINQENALAEEVRQHNQNYELKVKEYEEGIRQFNEEIARLKAKDAQEHALEIQRLELQKAQLAEEQRQFNATHSGGSGGGSGGSGSINKSSGGGSSVKKDREEPKSGNKTTLEVDKPKSSGPTPNMASIMALGYGAISESKLNSLVSNGTVIEYEKDGQLYYKRAGSSAGKKNFSMTNFG